MSAHAAIPEGVDPRSAELLRRAYELTDVDDGQELYVEWAATYDRTMVDELGYILPRLLVELFASHASSLTAGPIIDLGCGTGLVGAELAAQGLLDTATDALDGLDLSAAMMEQAAARSIYRNLIVADLTAVLPTPDRTYSAALCCGTFTSGHVDASCLGEIVRVLAPGGLLTCAVNHAVWDAFGFGEGFRSLVERGAIEEVEVFESPFYANSESTDGRLCLWRRREL